MESAGWRSGHRRPAEVSSVMAIGLSSEIVSALGMSPFIYTTFKIKSLVLLCI
jgi:hypothetical protein